VLELVVAVIDVVLGTVELEHGLELR